MQEPSKKIKPLLRGHLHQNAFFIAVGACLLLIAKSSNTTMVMASSIYSLGLLMMFGISALYHRPHWQPKGRALMKRLDHSAIFILIAGTMTPICLLALPEESGKQLLVIAWVTAAVGILQSIFWVKAPKYVTASFYVIMGWLILPYLSELQESLSAQSVTLLFVGGAFYTVGAVFYATKWPKLAPTIFGYHEFFHAFTIVAAILHFIAIYPLIH